MVVNKRKKGGRSRGASSHGWGARKKRRGQGNHGGHGNAGSGKRAQSKKQMFIKMGEGLGQHGFYSLKKDLKHRSLNLGMLNQMLQNKKIVEKDGIIDLGSYNYQKLLSAGEIKKKVKIKVARFSQKAEEKVKAAGGSLFSKKSKVTEETTGKETVSEA